MTAALGTRGEWRRMLGAVVFAGYVWHPGNRGRFRGLPS